MEIAGFLLTAAAAATSWISGDPRRLPLAVAAALGFAVLATFPPYFQRANASFARATIQPNEVAPELRRWAAWHGARVAAAVAAFAVTVLAH